MATKWTRTYIYHWSSFFTEFGFSKPVWEGGAASYVLHPQLAPPHTGEIPCWQWANDVEQKKATVVKSNRVSKRSLFESRWMERHTAALQLVGLVNWGGHSVNRVATPALNATFTTTTLYNPANNALFTFIQQSLQLTIFFILSVLPFRKPIDFEWWILQALWRYLWEANMFQRHCHVD